MSRAFALANVLSRCVAPRRRARRSIASPPDRFGYTLISPGMYAMRR